MSAMMRWLSPTRAQCRHCGAVVVGRYEDELTFLAAQHAATHDSPAPLSAGDASRRFSRGG